MGEHHTPRPARFPDQTEYQAVAAQADESTTNLIAAVMAQPNTDPGAVAAGVMAALVRHVADHLVPPLTSKRLYGMVMVSCAKACDQEVKIRRPPPDLSRPTDKPN